MRKARCGECNEKLFPDNMQTAWMGLANFLSHLLTEEIITEQTWHDQIQNLHAFSRVVEAEEDRLFQERMDEVLKDREKMAKCKKS